MLILWAHGKESGPWGSKLTALVKAARDLGFEADSLDYRSLPAEERVKKLVVHGRKIKQPLVLAGSSMGGYVAAEAACRLSVAGLFLLAPALYRAGEPDREYRLTTPHIAIVHGWRDTIIPPENSFRFAARHRAELHLVDGDHRLIENLPEILVYYTRFLETVRGERGKK